MNERELRLLNEFQRDFPPVAQPYRVIAERLGVDERWVLERLSVFQREGLISRVGAVFVPGTVGASALAALEVAVGRLEEVAATVSAFPQVNHNYEREHWINLWFVVTAEDEVQLEDTLGEIESRAQCGPLLRLRLVEEFRVDLGFDLRGEGGAPALVTPQPCARRRALGDRERRLLAALADGLPLVSRPFAALAEAAGSSEAWVLDTIGLWLRERVIRRMGVIVRHRELGYVANAMVVWDVPDGLVRPLAMNLAQERGVTLCYRRTRERPRWPFNLYCMLHGKRREAVTRRLAEINAHTGLGVFGHQVLFARRCYKQTGPRYATGKAFAYG
jgi:DNA-binding Lrp family transcriptional regulator